MNLFKFLIPKEKAQEVTVLQSWTVTWYVKTGWSGETRRQAKVFVDIADANEFKKQLNESAKFLGCWIQVDLTEN